MTGQGLAGERWADCHGAEEGSDWGLQAATRSEYWGSQGDQTPSSEACHGQECGVEPRGQSNHLQIAGSCSQLNLYKETSQDVLVVAKELNCSIPM